ncbi:(4Fe-4S)-binding protein [Listeria rocourtiae]|uniref:(4Fe-4S)-binding protein n=1 Tax=Listeria rocourtiae TaxID=647910 RepID=UPI003D2F634D
MSDWIEKGYREYRGEKIDVYFNTAICAHAAECVKGDPAVFNTSRKPWIVPDNASPEKVQEVIHRCPSGALKYQMK